MFKKIASVALALTIFSGSSVFASSDVQDVSADLKEIHELSKFTEEGQYPKKVEFGSVPCEGVCTQSFGTMATGESFVYRSIYYPENPTPVRVWEYSADGITDPKSLLYTVSALTSLSKKTNGSWGTIADGDKVIRVGVDAESSVQAITGAYGDFRAFSQHSVAYGGDIFIVYTADTENFPAL